MVWEIIYSKNPEEALAEIESRRLNRILGDLFEGYILENELGYVKNNCLKISGGKLSDKVNNRLTKKILETRKSF